jgi:hypothetical protein
VAKTTCGFNDTPGTPGHLLLTSLGPTIFVNIGFDQNFNPQTALAPPVPGILDVQALVDTGATECCIDGLLATQLGLPIVDRRPIAGVGGKHEVNMHMAQVYVPTLNFWIYGVFAGVDLAAGGQVHRALMGRTFLRHFTMVYEGRNGTVMITNE